LRHSFPTRRSSDLERAFQSYKANNREVIKNLGFTDNEVSRVNRLFNEAYTKENQPETNGNGMGDYGENAMAMQRSLEGLPIYVRYKIAMDPELQRSLFTEISRVEDFTEQNLAAFQQRLESIEPLPYMAKSSAKGLRLGTRYNNSFNEAIDRGDPYAMAYTQSVHERWSGRMPAYRESEEFRGVEDYIKRKGRDGLTSAEIQEMVRQAVSQDAQYRSIEEDAEKENRGRFINDITINRTQDHASPEYNEFMSILNGNHPQLTFDKMQEIIGPAMRGDSKEAGGFISNNEYRDIINAIRDLIPALRENTTTEIEFR
jgi:hypothetical protein